MKAMASSSVKISCVRSCDLLKKKCDGPCVAGGCLGTKQGGHKDLLEKVSG